VTEVSPSLDELKEDVKCGYVAHDASEHRYVYRAALPRAAPVALLSDGVWCDLAGVGAIQVDIVPLDEFLR